LSAASFNATTGKLTPGCVSARLKGYVAKWSYVAALALETNTGTGSVLYAAEFGPIPSIAFVQIGSSAGKCTLTEITGSPAADPNSPGLLSITSFPPPL
jgi:hypothetical protein